MLFDAILMYWLCDRRTPFLESVAGQDVEKRLYSETMVEMRRYVAVSQDLMLGS